MSRLIAIVLAVCVALGGWGWWEFQPQRQLGHKQRALLDAAGDRNWKRVEDLMAADYRDAWGQDRSQALELGRQLGVHFFALDVAPRRAPAVTLDGVRGRWSAPLDFRGRGTTVGEALLSEAAILQAEFVFDWRRESWEPWSWKLVATAQPDIPAIP